MANSRLEEIRSLRLAKLAKLKSLGIDPYPPKYSQASLPIAAARDNRHHPVSVSGRLWKIREHGQVVFADLRDSSGQIQLLFQEKNHPEKFSLLKLFDVGDFLGVTGSIMTTAAGETTIDVTSFELLSKSLRPLPDDWYGLTDEETRYRQRYVDLLLNDKVRQVFLTRTKIVTLLRERLNSEGFMEVETPVLQPVYGGTVAKPFTTHHNELDSDLYLRISDELYLKRLIVGGLDKVYEIGRDFRNEGVDRAHNPEFTMLEFYWAYSDYEKLMAFTEKLLSDIVKQVTGSYTISYQGQSLDFTPPWPRLTYRDAIKKYSGIDINEANTEDLLRGAIVDKYPNIKISGVTGYGNLMDILYKHTSRPQLTGPLFLTERPTAFVALAKRLPDDPSKTASFQLLVCGTEILTAYNELNDPQDQAARWLESESAGGEEHEVLDTDYIRALEYGMPPTAGWGMGIDRFTAIVTDQSSLKDTILFPTLRPESNK